MSSTPIRASSRLGIGDLALVLADQRQRSAPRDAASPRYVTNDPDSSNPRLPLRCPAANATRWRRSTTHSPDSSRGAARRRRWASGNGKIDGRRAFAVDHAHVRVVGGVCVDSSVSSSSTKACSSLVNAGLLWRCCPIVDAVLVGRTRLSRSCRNRASGTPAAPSGSSSARRRTERYCARVSVSVSASCDQVGAAGAAEQQRAAGEHADGVAGLVAQFVADVVLRVAGRVNDPQHDRPGLDGVAVDDPCAPDSRGPRRRAPRIRRRPSATAPARR